MTAPTLPIKVDVSGEQQLDDLIKKVGTLQTALGNVNKANPSATADSPFQGFKKKLADDIEAIKVLLSKGTGNIATGLAGGPQGVTEDTSRILKGITQAVGQIKSEIERGQGELLALSKRAPVITLATTKATSGFVGPVQGPQQGVSPDLRMMAGSYKMNDRSDLYASQLERQSWDASLAAEASKLKASESLNKTARAVNEQERRDAAAVATSIHKQANQQELDAAAAADKLRERQEREAAARLALARKTWAAERLAQERQTTAAILAEAAARDRDIQKSAKFQRQTPARQYGAASEASFAMGSGLSEAAAITAYGSAAVNAAKSLDTYHAAAQNVNLASKTGRENLKLHTQAMHEAHSAARGLAGGFGALWLTYGSTVPLVAGAALSGGFMAILKQGAQVNDTFTRLGALSQETAESVNGLKNRMLELSGTGPFGPLEVAQAMKTLSLAGLDAKEVLQAIKPVLNFSIAGDTSIAKAADVLTTVATAFKYTSNEFAVVSDVIAKTAAVSKSSVESIGEAFKTASVLGAQYKVSLEDVGLGLAALSNLGIQGTAAGTALRNMYTDMSGRTKAVRELLKKLKLDLRDEFTGGFSDLLATAEKVNAVMGTLSKRKQLDLKQALYSERGSKPIIEVMELLQQKAKQTGDTFENEARRLQGSINANAGFSSVVSAQAETTALNVARSLKATLQKDFVDAFQVLEPTLIGVGIRLREAFASQEFNNALQSLAIGVTNFTLFLVDHGKALGVLITAYASFKVAMTVGTLLTSLRVGILGIGTAAVESSVGLTAMAGAQGVAGTASVSLATKATATEAALLGQAAAATGAARNLGVFAAGASRLLGFINPLAMGVMAAVTAYELYDLYSTKAADSNDKFSGSWGEEFKRKLLEQTKAIDDRNAALREGMSLEGFKTKKDAEQGMAQAMIPFDKNIKDAEATLARSTANNGKTLGPRGVVIRDNNLPGQQRGGGSRSQIQIDTDRLNQAKAAKAAEAADIQGKVDTLLQKADLERREIATRRKNAEVRPQTAVNAANEALLGGGAKGVKASTNPNVENFTGEVEKQFNQSEQTLREKTRKELALLDSKHKNLLISEGAYQAQLLLIESDAAAQTAQMQKDQAEDLRIAQDKELKALKNRKLEPDDRKKAESKIAADYALARGRSASEIAKQETEATIKQAQAKDTAAGAILKAQKSAEAYIATMQANRAAETLATDTATANYLARKVFTAGELASQEALKEGSAKLREMDEQLKLLSKSEEDYNAIINDGTTRADEQRIALEALRAERQGELAAAQAARAKVNEAIQVDAKQAGRNATQTQIDKDAKSVNDAIKTAVINGIVDGGREGFKDVLRNAAIAFLKAKLTAQLDVVINPVTTQISKAAGFLGDLIGNFITGGFSGGGGGTTGDFARMDRLSSPYANGGDPPLGQPILVGERGPEVFMSKSPGTIIPNHALGGGLGGESGGGGAITIVNQTTGKIDRVTEQKGDNGERMLILHEASEMALTKMQAQLADPGSLTSRGMSQAFNLQRER